MNRPCSKPTILSALALAISLTISPAFTQEVDFPTPIDPENLAIGNVVKTPGFDTRFLSPDWRPEIASGPSIDAVTAILLNDERQGAIASVSQKLEGLLPGQLYILQVEWRPGTDTISHAGPQGTTLIVEIDGVEIARWVPGARSDWRVSSMPFTAHAEAANLTIRGDVELPSQEVVVNWVGISKFVRQTPDSDKTNIAQQSSGGKNDGGGGQSGNKLAQLPTPPVKKPVSDPAKSGEIGPPARPPAQQPSGGSGQTGNKVAQKSKPDPASKPAKGKAKSDSKQPSGGGGQTGNKLAKNQNSVATPKLTTKWRRGKGECLSANLRQKDKKLIGAAYMDKCTDTPDQTWVAVPHEDFVGYHMLVNPFEDGGKCLTGNTGAKNAPKNGFAYVTKCDSSEEQMWKGVEVPGHKGYYRLKTLALGPKKCLEGGDIYEPGRRPVAAFMDNCQNVTGQMWINLSTDSKLAKHPKPDPAAKPAKGKAKTDPKQPSGGSGQTGNKVAKKLKPAPASKLAKGKAKSDPKQPSGGGQTGNKLAKRPKPGARPKLTTMWRRGKGECLSANLRQKDKKLGGAVYMDKCSDTRDQAWLGVPSARFEGYLMLVNPFKGGARCLTGNTGTKNAPKNGSVYMTKCGSSKEQMWKRVEVPGQKGFYRLKSLALGPKRCLEGSAIYEPGRKPRASHMTNCQNVTGQFWTGLKMYKKRAKGPKPDTASKPAKGKAKSDPKQLSGSSGQTGNKVAQKSKPDPASKLAKGKAKSDPKQPTVGNITDGDKDVEKNLPKTTRLLAYSINNQVRDAPGSAKDYFVDSEKGYAKIIQGHGAPLEVVKFGGSVVAFRATKGKIKGLFLTAHDNRTTFEAELTDAAKFIARAALENSATGFASFESVARPGEYLRHQGYFLKLDSASPSSDSLTRRDATFRFELEKAKVVQSASRSILTTLWRRGKGECLSANLRQKDKKLGGAVYMDKCSDTLDQAWTLVPHPDFKGYLMFVNKFEGGGMCLTGNTGKANAPKSGSAYMTKCDSSKEQLWQGVVYPGQKGYVYLKTLALGPKNCLEGSAVYEPGRKPRASHMTNCQNVTGQAWIKLNK